MIFSDEITIHGSEPHFSADITADVWNKYIRQGIEKRYCSYCGSLHPEDLYELLDVCDRAEFADRKYGYPHKIYIDVGKAMLKFYTRHLLDVNDPETLNLIINRIKEKTGVWLKSHLEK